MSSAAGEEDAAASAAELLEALHLPHEGSYQDPCLDFFLVDAATPPQRFQQLLAAAWAHDDLIALKLVCNLCVRDAGKEGFYASALWMHRNRPRTLAGNLSAFADFGFIEYFPELLYRLVVSAAEEEEEEALPSARTHADPAPASSAVRGRTDRDTGAVPVSPATRASTDHAPAPAAPTAAARKRARTGDDDNAAAATPKHARTDVAATAPSPASSTARTDDDDDDAAAGRSSRTAAARKHARTIGDDDTATAPAPSSPTTMKTAEPSGAVVDRVKVDDNAGPLKKAALKYADLAAKMYKNDAEYKFLFDSIAGFFSERLRSDHKHLKDGNMSKIGLTAKWCPRPGSAFDQTTLLSDAIARSFFFSGDSSSTPPIVVTDTIQDEEKGHDLCRDVLAPLILQMQNLPQANKKAKTELPHEIIRFLEESKSNADTMNRAVQQWENMVAEARDKRCLIDCTVVCDFSSGSLFKSDNGSEPAMVAVALALLISELSCNAWKDEVYPFRDGSVRLRSYNLSNKSLVEKIERIRGMECQSNFSLRKVFETVLGATKKAKTQIKPEDLVKTIFVFSCRDFNQAIEPPGPIRRDEDFNPDSPRLWWEDYDIMKDKFIRAGYGEYMPQVVFWNLCGQRSAALTSIKDGVLHLSGYSDEFLRLFLEKSGVVYPEDEMSHAIFGEEYEKLKVLK